MCVCEEVTLLQYYKITISQGILQKLCLRDMTNLAQNFERS